MGAMTLTLAAFASPGFAQPEGEPAGSAGSDEAATADTEEEAPPACVDGRTRDQKAALVFGPMGATAARGDVEELVACRLDEDEGIASRVVRLDEIPFPEAHPLWVLGADQDQLCGAGVAPPRWAEVIDAGRAELDSLETAAAKVTFDGALENLACADSIVEREVLGTLYMLRGLARFYEGGEASARQDFRRAVTVNPGIEWDDSYPPEPKQVYLKAREDIYLQGRGRVEAVFLPGEVLQVVVDGQSVAAGQAGGLDVNPGYHLLQYMMPDQTLVSRVTYIEGGETRLLVSRAGLENSLLVGGSQPDNAPVARALLQELSADWAAERIYVADVGEGAVDESYVYRFSREGARFEKLQAPVRRVADDGTVEEVEPQSSVEGLLVLPNAVAEGSTSTITAESSQIDGDERIYLGEYEVVNLARAGVRSTFGLPDKIPAGVYDIRIVEADGSDVTFPRAFSVIGDSRATDPAPPSVVIVQQAQPELVEPDERLRMGVHWGFAYYRGTWATLDLEMDLRLGEGFCLDGAVGTRMADGYYPHAYWRAGFKIRWYPRIINGYFSINFQQFFEDLYMGPRAAVGLDIVIPSVKSLYITLEAGGGAMFEADREVYGWFHFQGGTGMRF
jgi:hypothetical protein